MNEKQQLIKNCHSSKILESYTLSPSAASFSLATNTLVEGTDHESQEQLDFYNLFTLNLNLQIYEEIRGRIDFEIVDKHVDVNIFKLAKKINVAQLECWTEEEIKENLVMPIIDEFIDELKENCLLQVFIFAHMSPVIKGQVGFTTRIKSVKFD